MALHTLHLDDLRKSGLTDETIEEAKIASVSLDISTVLGFDIPKLKSCYEIPYDENFSRYKAFYTDAKGKKPKYLQRKNSGNHLYFPPTIRPFLNDPAIPLYITEGEKKALRAAQDGICCIGLAGLWSWSDGAKKLISDFDRIHLEGRTVNVVPDNDYLEPNKHRYSKNLLQAVNELADRLKARGATVFVVELPPGSAKGLDDYLCSHSVDEFRCLPATEVMSLADRIHHAEQSDVESLLSAIAELPSQSLREIRVRSLSEKVGVSRRALTNDMKKYLGPESHGSQARSGKPCAVFENLVDLVTDGEDGVSFLVLEEDRLRVVDSYEVNGISYFPPGRESLPFSLPRAEQVLHWYNQDNDEDVYHAVNDYFLRFSYLDDKQRLLVANFAFLTYIHYHRDVHYCPELVFYAVPERGKSRTGKAITNIAYRGIHTVELREANLFRYSRDLHATLFIDVMDLWEKAVKSGSQDILLLRYEKGAKVARVLYPERGPFEDTEHFEIYGPTIIATNRPLHQILDTRSIPLEMMNVPGNYENPSPDKAQELKERLTAWRARRMNCALPEVQNAPGVVGRLHDISRPLLQVCQMVNPAGVDKLREIVLELAGQRAEDKRESIEGLIVGALRYLSDGLAGLQWIIKTSTVLDRVNASLNERQRFTPQRLGKRLKALSLRTRKVHGYSEVVLEMQPFNTLLLEYGLEPLPILTPPETPPNSTTPQDAEKPHDSPAGESPTSAMADNFLPAAHNKPNEEASLVESGRESEGSDGQYIETPRQSPSNPFADRIPVIFDLEIYPNYFLAVFWDQEGWHCFNLESRAQLTKYVSDGPKIFVGFNNVAFDNKVLRYVLDNERVTESEVCEYAQQLIDCDEYTKSDWLIGRTVDLLRMKFRNRSLKEMAARIGYERIEGLPYPPGTMLTPGHKEVVLQYCKNDVSITASLWELVQEDVSVRLSIQREYGLDVLTDSEAGICERLFRHLYVRGTGLTVSRPPKRGDVVKVKELLPTSLNFSTPALANLLEQYQLKEGPIEELDTQLRGVVELYGIRYILGAGGVHSQDRPGVFIANEEESIIDLDVTSYYPSIILGRGFCPAHLTTTWVEILRSLRDARLRAKKAGDKVLSDSLKIVINGANGKTKEPHSFMYDPGVYYSVVLTGQFYLLMLIEELLSMGLTVLSANTDGVIVRVPLSRRATLEDICKKWCDRTGLSLERTDIKRYFRKDVNNYVAELIQGGCKTKGIFTAPSLSGKADAPVVRRAVVEYLLHGVPLETTILSEKDVLSFSYSFSAKGGYTIYAGQEPVGATARWYVSRGGIQLLKKKDEQVTKLPDGQSAVLICVATNREVPKDLDHEHYVQRASAIVEKIQEVRG